MDRGADLSDKGTDGALERASDRVDHGHLGAEAARRGGHLQPDEAGAGYDEARPRS